MTAEDEILSGCLRRAAEGDAEAIERLWNYFYPRLKTSVSRRIASMPRLVGETSDLTSTSLYGFLCNTLRNPEFDLTDVNDVWKFLQVVTLRHISDVSKNRYSQKRGGLVSTTSLDHFIQGMLDSGEESSHQYVGAGEFKDSDACDPSQSVLFDDFVDHLLSLLKDEKMRDIALMRLAGSTNGEIAELMKVSIRTVQRHIKGIERTWMNDREFRSILGEEN